MSHLIPITLVEPNTISAKNIQQGVVHHYDVVQVCHEAENAVFLIMRALAGTQEPAFIYGGGSNENSNEGERRAPRAVVVMESVAEDVFESIKNALRGPYSHVVVTRPKSESFISNMSPAMSVWMRLDEHIFSGRLTPN